MSAFIDGLNERPTWQKVAFWVGSCALLSYLFWQFLVADKWEEEEKLGATVRDLQNSIIQERRISQELGKFQQEVAVLEVKLKAALQELPDKREIDDLLVSISTLARDSGLNVLLFKPSPEVRKEFYAEVPVAVSVEGTYHQVASFFDEVGHLPRIVNINQIIIREPKVGEQQVMIKSESVATTFRYLDESERIQNPEGDKGKRRKK